MDNDKLDMILNRLDDINKLRTELAEWKKELTGRVESIEKSVEFAHNEIKELKSNVNNKAVYSRVKKLRGRF